MVVKREFIYARCGLILIAILIIIASGGTSTAKTNYDGVYKINLEKWKNFPILEAKAGEVLNVEYTVTCCGDVDVLLMTPSDYDNYVAAKKPGGAIKYIAEGSVINQRIKKYTYAFAEGGDYQLVIDNTGVPKGGASPLDQVEMNLKVSVTQSQIATPEPTGDVPYSVGATPTPAAKTPGFEAIVAAFVIVTLALRRR